MRAQPSSTTIFFCATSLADQVAFCQFSGTSHPSAFNGSEIPSREAISTSRKERPAAMMLAAPRAAMPVTVASSTLALSNRAISRSPITATSSMPSAPGPSFVVLFLVVRGCILVSEGLFASYFEIAQ